MDSAAEHTDVPAGGNLAALRKRKLEQTSLLLGDTIALSDTEWQSPSRLPGWTRAHVATHLARNADGFVRVVEGLLNGQRTRMYLSDSDRDRDLEAGSLRPGMQLQIDLDTSASALNRAFDAMVEHSDLTEPLELRAGLRMPAAMVPVARMHEVVVHHADLDTGFELTSVPVDVARVLVDFSARRLEGRADVPATTVRTDSGLEVQIGAGHGSSVVHGTDQAVLAWLTGRAGADAVSGAGSLVLPLM